MKHIPDWPRAMKRATAAAYCDMSVASFDKEVALGRLPGPVMLGGLHHWSRRAIDESLERLAGDTAPDWREQVPMYAKG